MTHLWYYFASLAHLASPSLNFPLKESRGISPLSTFINLVACLLNIYFCNVYRDISKDDDVIRSMVNTVGLSFPDHCIPEDFFRTHVFGSPFECCLVVGRGWSLLDYFFLFRSCVLEFSIQAKMVHFWGLFLKLLNCFECVQSHIHWVVRSRGWLDWVPFL